MQLDRGHQREPLGERHHARSSSSSIRTRHLLQKLHCAVPMMPSASAMPFVPLLLKRLTSQTPPASLQPAALRRGQSATLSLRHCRKPLHAAATSTLALLLVHWRLVERRRAQRVQSPSCPPQQRPSWHAPD